MDGIFGLILGGFALAINIIGLAIPYWWYYGGNPERIVYVGLWQFCVTINDETTCISLPEIYAKDSTVVAVRALELLGMVGMAAATVCMLVKIMVMHENERMPNIAGVTAIASGLLMVVGAVIFTTIDSIDGVIFHAGVPLCFVAGVLAQGAGVLAILNK